jgi:hypothetical protein
MKVADGESMKFKIILVLLSVLILLSFILGDFIMSNFSPNPNDRKYYKIFEENGKYYYISHISDLCHDKNEKVFIEFEDDLALIDESKIIEHGVTSINIFKYIDKKGKVVLMPDVYRADVFSEGLAAVIPYEGNLWGYINKNAEMVIEPKYSQASMFKDGFASVNAGKKWILINNKGEYIRDLDKPLNWL